MLLTVVWLALPAPAQARVSTMTITHSQARRPSDLQRQLLGLVASSAECIGSFSRAQLTETEGLTSITPLESRRLRRMWDDRLAWRLRQRPTADAAEACGPSTTSASVRSHVPSTTMRSHQELWQSRLNDPRWAKQELWRAEAVAARGDGAGGVPIESDGVRPYGQLGTHNGNSGSHHSSNGHAGG